MKKVLFTFIAILLAATVVHSGTVTYTPTYNFPQVSEHYGQASGESWAAIYNQVWVNLETILSGPGLAPISVSGNNRLKVNIDGTTLVLTADSTPKIKVADPLTIGTLNATTITGSGSGITNVPGALGYTLQVDAPASSAPADGQTYYFGQGSSSTSTGTTLKRIYIPRSGTITAVSINWFCTAGTNEQVAFYIRLNNSTDTTISTTIDMSAGTGEIKKADLSIPVTGRSGASWGDYIHIKWVCPTWATNPTGVTFSGYVYVQ